MTDAAALAPRRTGPSLTAVAAAAICAFVFVLAFLAWQLQAGQDPALGTAASSSPVRQLAGAATSGSTHTLVTRSSGGGVSVAPAARTHSPVKSHGASAPVTRSSGGG